MSKFGWKFYIWQRFLDKVSGKIYQSMGQIRQLLMKYNVATKMIAGNYDIFCLENLLLLESFSEEI